MESSPPRPPVWPQIRVALMAVVVTLGAVYLCAHYGVGVRQDTIPGPRIPGESEATDKTFQSTDYQAFKRTDYEFTKDWFTRAIPVWEAALSSFKGKPGVQYLEIGAWEGMSCVWMLENVLTDPAAHLSALDLFEDPVKGRFLRNMERTGAKDKTTLILGLSQVELRRLPLHAFDIIYIDGSHEAPDVLEDAVLSWRLLKDGGILIFDDYLMHPAADPLSRPKISIDFFYKLYGRHFEVVHSQFQLILRKKVRERSEPGGG